MGKEMKKTKDNYTLIRYLNLSVFVVMIIIYVLAYFEIDDVLAKGKSAVMITVSAMSINLLLAVLMHLAYGFKHKKIVLKVFVMMSVMGIFLNLIQAYGFISIAKMPEFIISAGASCVIAFIYLLTVIVSLSHLKKIKGEKVNRYALDEQKKVGLAAGRVLCLFDIVLGVIVLVNIMM